jgi:hypothetical protein
MVNSTIRDSSRAGAMELLVEVTRVSPFWAVLHDTLGNASFAIYGALLAYTSTKSFRNGFPKRGPLKLSITYLTASLALSFTSTIQGLWWTHTIWRILRIPWVVFVLIYYLCGLSLPLFYASVLEALSHIERDGQARKVGWKKFVAMTLVHVQAAVSLLTVAIECYMHVLITCMSTPECAPARLGMVAGLSDAKEVVTRLLCGVTPFTTISIFYYAATLRNPNAPSSTEGANVSTTSPTPTRG